MKILHTADWHIGKKLDFFSRIEEQKAALNEIVEIAEREEVDVVLVAGDLFDNFNPSNEAMEVLYKTLNKLGNGGKRPVIAIAGNHDSPERINVPDVFARTNGVIFIGRPTDVVPLFKTEDGFEVINSEEGFLELKLAKYDYPIRILHTAFANEQRLLENLGEDTREGLQNTLQNKWKTLADNHCDESGVNILTTHLYMQKRGGETLKEPQGEKPLNIGNAEVIYSDAIPEKIQYTALGHLHRYHNVGDNQKPVIYSGSPVRYSFSEEGQKKYVAIITLSPGENAQVEQVSISGGKKLERKLFTNVPEAVDWLKENQECLVELTIETQTFLTAAEQKDIRDSHRGIIHLIPRVTNDPVLQAQEAGLVREEADLTESFKGYFRSTYNGQEPSQEIMQLLQEILNTDTNATN